ncbi:coiled-coil domain-containing protein 102A-like [Symsagittifera roscoffensis]|uniref:coiled-coil domain-containing protein 102A-like n=1 Tax=Symsagittifera roscoffensis TaxID=84072 RepID=UPI00307B27F9
MDRIVNLESTDRLRNSNSSLDSDSTSDTSFLGINPLDESKLREIEELRARAAQTEQTMKWWSDCTQNWREKWSKVRNERNTAREEVKQLNKRLDDTLQQVEKVQQEKKLLKAELDRQQRQNSNSSDHGSINRYGSLRLNAPYDWTKSATQAFMNATGNGLGDNTGSIQDQDKEREGSGERNEIFKMSTEDCSFVDSEKSQRALQIKLEEANKIIMFEREASKGLQQEIDTLSEAIRKLQGNIQQLTISKEAVSFELKTARQNHESQIANITSDLADSNSRNSELEKRIATLHEDIEQLQMQNTDEWSKREQLETEKFQLEREIKKFKNQIADLESRAVRNQKTSLPGTPSTEVTELKTQIQQLHIQIGNMKHSEAKLKKAMNEKTRDMELLERRNLQSEAEVKSLRGRVEQLKRETIEALEENDVQTAQINKTSRDLEDKTELVSELEQEIIRLKRKIDQVALQERDTDEEIQS